MAGRAEEGHAPRGCRLMRATYEKAPAVNPTVRAAGDEGLNPTTHEAEGGTTMFSFSCSACDLNLMSPDTEASEHDTDLSDCTVSHCLAEAEAEVQDASVLPDGEEGTAWRGASSSAGTRR